MTTIDRRRFLQALFASGALTATGCFGSFKATNFILDFNRGLGGKFLQWLVFLGLIIIPVYEIAVLVDVWILNSLEFWFGGGSAKKEELQDERLVQLGDGRTMRLRADRDAQVLHTEVVEGDRVVSFTLHMGEQSAALRVGGKIVLEAREHSDGAVEVVADGRVLAVHTAEEVAQLQRLHDDGGDNAVAQWAGARSEAVLAAVVR